MTVDSSTQAQHITITGDLGSGKSTVAGLIAEMTGLKLVSTGAIQRSMAQNLSLSTLEVNFLAERDRRVDQEVDGVTQRLGRESVEPIIFDSRMAWKMVPTSVKVRLIVDPAVAAGRVLSRVEQAESYETRREVEVSLRQRFDSEVKRFLDRYGVDVTSFKHYDLVVDASFLSAEAIARLVVRRYRRSDVVGREVLISPRSLVPTSFDFSRDLQDSGSLLPVAYNRPTIYSLVDLASPQWAVADPHEVVPVEVVAEGGEQVIPGVQASDLHKFRL